MKNLDQKEVAAILALIAEKEEQFLEHSIDSSKPNPNVSTKDLATFAKIKVKLQPEKFKDAIRF